MKINTQSLFIVMSVFFALSACKKDNPGSSKGVDVYVAGNIVYADGQPGAAYWKNGEMVKFADSTNAFVTGGIAVHGSDVYVAGIERSTDAAVYWKNGSAPTVLSVPSGYKLPFASFIAFKGNDMYVGGRVVNNSTSGLQAVYWKNGTANILADGTIANAIAFSGNDVYIAGSVLRLLGAYWKNGGAIVTENVTTANSIAVNGSDVYLGGANTASQAVYAKNSAVTTLTNGGAVTGIATDGTNVFAAGNLNDNKPDYGTYPIYWKNGIATQLSTTEGYTAAITLNGSDVYVLGQNYDNAAGKGLAAHYWKNGTPVQLNSGSYQILKVSGMAVVSR